jgi:hypothetical protein
MSRVPRAARRKETFRHLTPALSPFIEAERECCGGWYGVLFLP